MPVDIELAMKDLERTRPDLVRLNAELKQLKDTVSEIEWARQNNGTKKVLLRHELIFYLEFLSRLNDLEKRGLIEICNDHEKEEFSVKLVELVPSSSEGN